MDSSANLRNCVIQALHHLDHVLPGQAPILDFVHHNTLHGFQRLPFEEALAEFENLTGICGYLPEEQFRRFYREGRINDLDLAIAMAANPSLRPDRILLSLSDKTLLNKALYSIAMHYDFSPLNPGQFVWYENELNAFQRLQDDIPDHVRISLLNLAPEQQLVEDLWQTLLNTLGLKHPSPHPESMLHSAPDEFDVTEAVFATDQSVQTMRYQAQSENQQQAIEQKLVEVFEGISSKYSLRDMLIQLTGVDVLTQVRPQLLRFCAAALDEGLAPWPLTERQLGFYHAWRKFVLLDTPLWLDAVPDWRTSVEELPDDPVDAIMLQLLHFEIPPATWTDYLTRLALELPGWSGMINWRQQHPDYPANRVAPQSLADYLAIRLTLDRLCLSQVCYQNWQLDARLSVLKRYFNAHPDEFWVRMHLFQGVLPEWLSQQAEFEISLLHSEWNHMPDWKHLADLIYTWQVANHKGENSTLSVYDGAWRLFRLVQHLGLTADEIRQLQKTDLVYLLATLDALDSTQRKQVWLAAYELHYREAFFQAIHANHLRGRWAERNTRAEAQFIFCMDDREEGFRRHLEELSPAFETLGAAGFFGVPMHYKGINDETTTPLCPIVVTPTNEVHERPINADADLYYRNQRGRKWLLHGVNLFYQGLRSQVVRAGLLMLCSAPMVLVTLLAKSFFPNTQQRWATRIKQVIAPPIATRLQFKAGNSFAQDRADSTVLGFTDEEQATRVAGFLKNTGLTYGFAPLVVLMGHGSMSQNNPHLAAYDCGACSGRHGGPNARLFAAMANRPVIRGLLAERGISIPADTWFVGAEHNTCDEDITGYDLDDVPESHQPAWEQLQVALRHAQQWSAHERCRRLASAPRNPSPRAALRHMLERASDFSQARPELGHATNAAAVIGRRSLTQGAFFDRRVFLISYDPTQDETGKILEGILLAVGPVGAGINLEYYFSTVNNERFGCGSKISHNVTGFFGVMDGTASDLRTGLPQQMIEIHEAMRLQILVEVKTSVLERIYAEQPSIRELIAGGWVHLSAKDPDSGEIFVFERGNGFVTWQPENVVLPCFACSPECYENHILPVAPALIRQSELQTV